MKKRISRKDFIKKTLLSLSLPTAFLWYRGVKKNIATIGKKRIDIPTNLPEGITFLDEIIIEKKGNNLFVFSSKCTHLGCKINSTSGDNLVCPCHGSQFDFNGIPQNGPAIKPLQKLEIVKNSSNKRQSVYV